MYGAASYITYVTELVKPLPKSKKRALTSQQRKQHNFLLGQIGEEQAAVFLAQRNFQILDRNFQTKHGEIDIVALNLELDEIVFVEVKTRAGEEFGSGSRAVNWQKKAALRRVAAEYCLEKQIFKDFRFDIITVVGRNIEHYENITW